ncbi:MAG: hypothetical protein ACFNLR_09460, partial [Prevotella denticola]
THTRFATPDELEEKEKQLDSMDNDEEELPEEDQKNPDEEDEEDSFDEDKLTEESYRTTFDTNPEDLEMQAAEVGDDDEF